MRFDIQYTPGQYDDKERQMHTTDQITEMKSFLDPFAGPAAADHGPRRSQYRDRRGERVMDAETLYRIEYSIQRMRPGDDDYVEIGFGSSGAWADIDMAAHMIESDVSIGAWETSGDMPDPEDVLSDIQGDKQ